MRFCPNSDEFSRLTMMFFFSFFSLFLREHSGLSLGIGIGIRLVLGDRVRVRYEVRVGSILFICTIVIENLNRKFLSCGILALCCNYSLKH